MKFALIFTAFAVIIASLCAGVLISAFDSRNYAENLQKNAIAEKLPDAEKRTENVFNYIKGREELNTSFFNEKEIMHMKDVRTLLSETAWLFFVSIVSIVFFSAVFVFEKDYGLLAKCFIYGGISTFISSAAIASASFNFSRFFAQFHSLFFSNDLWLMGSNDTLHILFPEQFFISMLIRVLVIAALLGAASLIFGIVFWRRNVHSRY